MFRSSQFVTSSCLLGTHRSLLVTVKDSQKPTLRTLCNSSLSQFCPVSREKGHQWKQHHKHESWNSVCISQKILHKSFSCLVNTSCSVKPSAFYCNVIHQANVLKGVSSDILAHCLRNSVPNKCLLPENQTDKHRSLMGKWTTHLNTSIKSQKSYHTVIEATSCKDNFSRAYELSRRLWNSSPSERSHCGLLTTHIRGLHKRVPHQATLEECLSAENEARCRGHLQPNTALYEKEKGKIWAAVLVSLCTVGGDPSFLFTLRSSKLRGRHKGDVSFAGGKRDPSDSNVVDTALREAREELGIAVTENKVWGVLKPLSDRSGMMVAPVLAHLGPLEALTFQPNPSEVEEIFTLSVAHVCNPQNRGYTHFRTGDRYGYTLPVFHNAKYRIWGLTAVALDHTLKLIIPV
ncbi:nucleoside diphosphate-linked moiety X motif 8 isoform X1 [Colossoma macropomum]|uniref:nucleoside diphosphate-linked moiety X motif 8 isoform X1 n=1 Tax=Colossoma macropomum TaxID=42526 RepID=UPI0018640999|nr:nucleoside diphosphate-linked moiety X motif 8 isoform X1 [Colossoma macropomum]